MDPILDAFERLHRQRPSAPALWSRGEGRRLTFGELAEGAAARVKALAALPAGQPVGLATGNGVAFFELFLALRRLGLPVVLLDAGQKAAERQALAGRLGVPTLLHRDPSAPGEELGDGVRCQRLATAEATAVTPGTALIKLTSGSTGQPRGLCLTAEALAAGIAQIAAGMELSDRDRVLIAIPLSHSYGFDNGVLSLLVAGTPLVLEPSIYPGPLLKALAEGEVTFLPAVPPMVRVLGESTWPDGLALRRVICAGGPLPPQHACRLKERSGRWVHQFYGSSETGGICFERRPQEPAAAGTVGHPLPGVEVSLGCDGRVSVASRAVFHALLGEESLGEESLGGGPIALADRAEWTDSGRLRLVGRTADLLNVGGRRVSAAALEAALRALDGVEDAAVVAVEDALRGDRVIGFVIGAAPVIDPGRLPAGLAPRSIRRLDALPYTARGKLDRGALRRLAQS